MHTKRMHDFVNFHWQKPVGCAWICGIWVMSHENAGSKVKGYKGRQGPTDKCKPTKKRFHIHLLNLHRKQMGLSQWLGYHKHYQTIAATALMEFHCRTKPACSLKPAMQQLIWQSCLFFYTCQWRPSKVICFQLVWPAIHSVYPISGLHQLSALCRYPFFRDPAYCTFHRNHAELLH